MMRRGLVVGLVGVVALLGLLALAPGGAAQDSFTEFRAAVTSTSITDVEAINETAWVIAWEQADDILFSKTEDSGQTWAAPVVINNTVGFGSGEFGLDLEVETESVYGVAYRVGNTSSSEGSRMGVTTDGGASWSNRVITTPTTPPTNSTNDVRFDIDGSGQWAVTWNYDTGSDGDGSAMIAVSSDRFATIDTFKSVDANVDGARRLIGGIDVEYRTDGVILVAKADVRSTQDGGCKCVNVFRSFDNGISWDLIGNATIADYRFDSIKQLNMEVADSTNIGIAAQAETSGATGTDPFMMFQVSIDGGSTWSENNPPDIMSEGDPGIPALVAFNSITWRIGYVDAPDAGFQYDVYATKDRGSSWTTQDDIGFNISTGLTPTSSVTLGVGGAQVNDTAYILSSPGTFVELSGAIDAGEPTPGPFATVLGFEDLTDVETNLEPDSPRVYVRDRAVSSTQQLVSRFSDELAFQVEERICNVAGFDGFSENTLTAGLTITFEERVIFPCLDDGTGRTSWHVADSGGGWSADQDAVFISGAGAFSPVSSRTLNDVLIPGLVSAAEGGGEGIKQHDAITLEVDEQPLEWDDAMIGRGGKGWVVASGSDGTSIWRRIGGTKVIPSTADDFESVRIHNETLWAHDADTDTLKRFTIEAGSGLNETHSLSVGGVNLLSKVRISGDGELLAVVQGDSDSVLVLNGSDLSEVGNASVTNPIDAAFDVNNNRLYVISQTTLFGFEVFNFPGGPGVESGAVPDQFDEEGTGEGVPEDVDSTALGPFGLALAAESFGVDRETAGWILGALIILGLSAGLFFLTESDGAAMGGGAAALAISTGLSWIPLWFTVTLGFIAAAVIVFLRR